MPSKTDVMDFMIDKLAVHNERNYNEDKLLEEMHELGEVILKMRNKQLDDPKRPSMQDLVEEAGDLKLRLEVFIRMMQVDALVDIRIGKKLNKFSDHLQDAKYGNRI